MRTLQLSSRTAEDWAGTFITDEHYDTLLDESAIVRKPDGSILCVLLKKALPKEILGQAWSVLRDYNPKTNNRGIAAGTGYVKQVKQDGTLSSTNRTPPEGVVTSGIIGFFERSVRFPYCRPCAFNLDHPEKFAAILPLLQHASSLYEQVLPEKFQYQLAYVEKSSKDFIIPGTIFSTVTVNKNFRTACHRDAGDLKDGYSCMALLREGKFSGANLVFPDFRVAAKLDTGDLIFFDPHEFHGNTMLVPESEKFQRCTIVMYYRDGIQFCGTAEQELHRAKNRKKGDPLK